MPLIVQTEVNAVVGSSAADGSILDVYASALLILNETDVPSCSIEDIALALVTAASQQQVVMKLSEPTSPLVQSKLDIHHIQFLLAPSIYVAQGG